MYRCIFTQRSLRLETSARNQRKRRVEDDTVSSRNLQKLIMSYYITNCSRVGLNVEYVEHFQYFGSHTSREKNGKMRTMT